MGGGKKKGENVEEGKSAGGRGKRSAKRLLSG